MQREPKLERATSVQRRVSLPLAISLAVHAALIIALVLWYVPRRGADASADHSAAGQTPGRAGDLREASPNPPQPGPSASPIEVPPQQLEQAVGSAIQGAAKVSDERKLAELESQVKRLDRVVSEDSLQEIAVAVAEASGLSKRATEPVTPPGEGSFDFDTAQFHSVTRTPGPDGAWQYRSVMIDARGHSMEVELDPEQGKTAYDAMQIVNQSPLAESIYRTMVMPMLDKMVPAGGARLSPPKGETGTSSD